MPRMTVMTASVVAVSSSSDYTFSKPNLPSIDLIAGFGVVAVRAEDEVRAVGRPGTIAHGCLDAVLEALANDEARFVVLRGAGGSFCSGGDLSLFMQLAENQDRELSCRPTGSRTTNGMQMLTVPVWPTIPTSKVRRINISLGMKSCMEIWGLVSMASTVGLRATTDFHAVSSPSRRRSRSSRRNARSRR